MPKTWGSVARRGAHNVKQGPSKEHASVRRQSEPPPPQDQWVLLEDDITVTGTSAPPTESRKALEVPGDVAAAIRRAASDATAYRREKLVETMGKAAEAYDRNRYEEAARLANRLAEAVPEVPAVRELAGLASYRASLFGPASTHLEAYRTLAQDPDYLPLEMDAARARGRRTRVEALFEELRGASPDPDTLAEGRIVLAASMADRARLKEAIELLESSGAAKPRRNPGERHLRQWYLLGDLYDKSGDVPRARGFFEMVASVDPTAYDVPERLAELGGARPGRSRRSK